jgi:hypothetical protein
MEAMLAGHNDIVELLLQQPDIDINMSNGNGVTLDGGLTALGCSILGNNPTGLAMLLRQRSCPAPEPCNKHCGRNHLQWHKHKFAPYLKFAVSRGSMGCLVELLGRPEVDAEAVSMALVCAVAEGKVDCARELARFPGVNLQAKDSQGRSLEKVARKEKAIHS